MNQDANPRAIIGSNSASTMTDAVARFDLAGYMLARYETLAMAVRDDRVDRACLKVLASLIATMNRDTRTSWAGREILAGQTGMTVKSVSNYIYQLKCLGYVVSERRPTPQANNRVLMHYTLAALSPEEIEAAITSTILSIRGEVDTVVQFPSPQEVKAGEFPSGQEPSAESSRQDRNSPARVPAPAGTQNETSRPSGNNIPVPTGTQDEAAAESSRPDGHSIIENARGSKTLTSNNNRRARGEGGAGGEDPAAKRGARLAADWKLPLSWGTWAVENYHVTADQVRAEAKRFKNHWLSKAGKDAIKLDWYRTWQNWCASDIRAWLPRETPTEHAPDLLDTAARKPTVDDLYRQEGS